MNGIGHLKYFRAVSSLSGRVTFGDMGVVLQDVAFSPQDAEGRWGCPSLDRQALCVGVLGRATQGGIGLRPERCVRKREFAVFRGGPRVSPTAEALLKEPWAAKCCFRGWRRGCVPGADSLTGGPPGIRGGGEGSD
jgi:hypothetical protein